MNLMNNFLSAKIISISTVIISVLASGLLLKDMNTLEAKAETRTDIESNQVIIGQEIDNKLDDNLVYFKEEKWNIAIPVATIGVFSIVLGILTMMLIESRLKKQEESYKE